jgi:hypothetical protein
MDNSGKPKSVDPFVFWYLIAAVGMALVLKFMVTDLLGMTSPDEPSTVYALLNEDS